jgi:hypothetical protein
MYNSNYTRTTKCTNSSIQLLHYIIYMNMYTVGSIITNENGKKITIWEPAWISEDPNNTFDYNCNLIKLDL